MSKKEDEYILSLHLARELAETLRTMAQEHQRSLHGEIVWAIREYVARQRKAGKKELHL